MNAEKQYKESSSNVVQSKQGSMTFKDKRFKSIAQAKLISNIQNKDGKITSVLCKSDNSKIVQFGKNRIVNDLESNKHIRNELFIGEHFDEAEDKMVPNEVPGPESLYYLRDYIQQNPNCRVVFAFMIRTPNHLIDKLKGEDGHASVQVYVAGNKNARVQVGLGGKGIIAKEVFADNYSRSDDKYTITIYHSEIEHEKANDVIAKIERDAGMGHKYSRMAHPLFGKINCALWAIEVARVAGFYFPLAYILGSDPLFLGRSLKESLWERTEYTKENPLGKKIDIMEEVIDSLH